MPNTLNDVTVSPVSDLTLSVETWAVEPDCGLGPSVLL